MTIAASRILNNRIGGNRFHGRISALLLAAAMTATSAVADFAKDENGLQWQYNSVDYNEAEVAGYWMATMGPGGSITLPQLYPAISANTAGNVAVPTTLGGRSVTGIGTRAFVGCSNLTGVAIHGNVKYIADGAFSGCTALSSITIPNSVTNIGASAFVDCASLSSMTIPDSVERIGVGAFDGCTSLTRVFLGNGVKTIGNNAFPDTVLETVYVSDIYAGPVVPHQTVGLSLSPSGDQELSEPLQVTGSCTIPGATMRYTTDGTTPTAASPVFQSYTADSKMTLTVGAFLNGELVLMTKGTYTLPAGTEIVDGRSWRYRPYGDGVEIFGIGAPEGLVPAVSPKPTGAVTIPATLGGLPVASVGELSFVECEGLTGVTFPACVTNIGNLAFAKCIGLTSMVIPSGVTRIGDWAFSKCSSLADVTIPDSVTSIGSRAFSDCHALLYDTNSIPGVLLVDGWAAGNDGQLSGDLVLAGIRGIGDGAISDCPALTRVWIADDVLYVGAGAFEDCTGLTSIVVGNGVKLIGDDAFTNTGSAPIYIADIYEGPRVDDMVTGLALALPSEQVLSEPTEISVYHSFDGIADLRYTTDGTLPTAESPLFVPFTVDSPMTVTVGEFFDDTRILVTKATYWMEQVETPEITIDPGNENMTAEVSISCDTLHAVIHYTLDGEDPTEESPEYEGFFTVPAPIGQWVHVKAKAFREDMKPSEIAEASFMSDCTLEEAVGGPDLTFVSTADRFAWTIDKGNGHGDGVSLRSSRFLLDGETSSISVTVKGPGRFSFWWKTSCEETIDSVPRDHVELRLSGSLFAMLDGVTDWQKVELTLKGGAEDSCTIEWRYVKDAIGEAEEDCAWIDDVLWQPEGDAFVSLGDKGTVEAKAHGYFATANDGVTITESDFIFRLSPDAYEIDIAPDGKTADVRLKEPEIGIEGGSVATTADSDDPTKWLVIVEPAHMSAIPAAESGQVVRALPVNTWAGLWYRASWGASLDDIQTGAKVQADGSELYLGVIRQDAAQNFLFYGVTVSEQ